MMNLNLMFDAQSYYIPKDNPGKPLGEDAHFFNKAAQVIGVADGVGSWARKGIDAGEYARELMTHAENAVYDRRPGEVDPMKVLVEASRRTEAPGSSTACIVALAGDNLLAASIGDSAFIVLRQGMVIYSSELQQHGFNSPYQLGNSGGCDPPEKAQEITVKVEIGDLVVVGTDGLFDNLYLDEIENIVQECWDFSRLPEDLARAALLRSGRHTPGRGPFSASAKYRRYLLKQKTGLGDDSADIKYARHRSKFDHVIRTGLKKDDITVVVAYII